MVDTAPAWDLDVLFEGGVTGEGFRTALHTVQRRMEELERRSLRPVTEDPELWVRAIKAYLETRQDIHELMSFSGCVAAANTRSTEARLAQGACRELYNRWIAALVPIDAGLDALDDTAFERFVAHAELETAVAWLRNRRAERHLRMPMAEERLLRDLQREALHGWGQLYDLVSGKLEATVQMPGEDTPRRMGVGQVSGLLSHPDGEVRRRAHEAGQEAWTTVEDVCATALTHIVGARQTRLDRVGADELEPTLLRNRIQRDTLEALFAAVTAARPSLVRYLERKAQLLGKAKLDWWDVSAPLAAGAGPATLSWDEARERVLTSFGAFDPQMEAFARRAFEQRWIEAEDRGHKRQGAYCTGFPRAQQSRVFMTWGGTQRTALTLAHELGHAWHNEVLLSCPPAMRNITSATAETASTFAEALFRDAAMTAATDATQKRAMVDQQLLAGANMLMNLPARFAFERQLYPLRRRGAFDPAELREIMVACQREAFGEALATWDPTFWASKLHYYISAFAFYNWPYTFGYLFSSAVYARAREEGPSFAPRVRQLLADMGHAWTEDLVQDVLGEDITDVAFWQRATSPLLTMVHEFLDDTAER